MNSVQQKSACHGYWCGTPRLPATVNKPRLWPMPMVPGGSAEKGKFQLRDSNPASLRVFRAALSSELSAVDPRSAQRKICVHDAWKEDRKADGFQKKGTSSSGGRGRSAPGHNSPADAASMGPSGLDRGTSAICSSARSHHIVGSQPDVPRRHHCQPPAPPLRL